MLKKLRRKFVVVVMAIVTVTMCLLLGLIYYFTQEGLERESVTMMRSMAANPFQPGRPDDRSGGVRLPYFIIELGARGEIIPAGGGYYDLSDQGFLLDLIKVCTQSERDVGLIEEYGLRFCRVDTPNGCRLVFADVTGERAALRSLLKTCAVVGVLCFAVFWGVSILLAFWMVKPVDKAWEQQKQFVADASHELKTPLTVIMTNAELLQSPDWNEEERTKFSGSILTMSRQMRSLVEALLELARADNGHSAAVLEPVNYSALLESALLTFEPVFFERGLTLERRIEPGITVRGNGSQLRQVADILLDNAQKYANVEGSVNVTLRQMGKRRCRVSVSNPGDPLSKRELTDIFKRFYRADKARSRDGSFGLGLSIAQSIVEQHHGRIWAESGAGVNIFYVELPTIEQ